MRNLNSIIRCYAVLISTFFFFTTVFSQVQTPRYLSMITNSNAFYEYLPQGYQSEPGTYPLLIFVHGIGELGHGTTTSLPTVLLNGPPRVIKDGKFPNSFKVRGDEFKFIVISPQFISWPTPTDIREVIEYAVSNYQVDTNRIYFTGLSMGGGVVWEYASISVAYASRIAGIVPVCGVAPSNQQKGQNIASANLPVWATHNDDDGTVEVSNTHNFIYYINSSNPPPNPLAKKTIFDDDSHDAWSKTYNPDFKENGLNVYEWMLLYQRGGGSQPVNQAPSSNAGPDNSITLPVNSTTLYGSGSDVDGNITKYSWSKISGPSQFTLSNDGIPSPTVSNLVEGTYTFKLTVTDDDNATASDDVVIKVNAAPSSAGSGGSITLPGRFEAENYTNMNGVLTENTTDAGGGKNVGWIDISDWMDYNVNIAYPGTYLANFRVSSPYANQRFQLRRSNGTVLATINVPKTGAHQTWVTVTASVSLNAGPQTLRIFSLQSGGWNINWSEFIIGNGYIPVPGIIEAPKFAAMSGIRIEPSNDQGGGWNVGWIDNGDWMDYAVDVKKAATYKVNLRVATPYTTQRFQVRDANGVVLATINVPQTGGNQSWTTISTNVSLPKGNQVFRIYSLQSGWNIKQIEFVDSENNSNEIVGNASSVNGILNENLNASQNGFISIETSDDLKATLGIYPNPVKEQLALRISNKYSGSMNVQIINESGAIIKSFRFIKNQPISQFNIRLNELPAGTYLLKVQMKEWRDMKKLIKL